MNFGHDHQYHDQDHHSHHAHLDPYDHQALLDHREHLKLQDQKENLLQFPYERVVPSRDDPTGYQKVSNLLDNDNALEKATIDKLEVLEVGDDGRKCVNKVMIREETEYDEVLTCDHSYDNRCHTSYVTKYEPHQEEVCEEKFRKICTIDYEQKANQEVVQVCKTAFVSDCEIAGPKVCKTVWTSECSTVQIVHEVVHLLLKLVFA